MNLGEVVITGARQHCLEVTIEILWRLMSLFKGIDLRLANQKNELSRELPCSDAFSHELKSCDVKSQHELQVPRYSVHLTLSYTSRWTWLVSFIDKRLTLL